MLRSTETVNEALEEFRAYLETLTFIQIDPRLRSKFGQSDVVQDTLVAAWLDLQRIQSLDAEGRKRWLRRMLMNKLLDTIDRWRTRRRDVRLEQSLEAAVEESSCQLRSWLAAEDTSPSEHLARQEAALRMLEALSKLDVRQSKAIILQQYHGWTLAQIAEYLGCTVGEVAGLHARGLKKLGKYLPNTE
jgi:RNA polymerase sigma-70 factor (ECF subfamily)